jgi:hypothetical protein
MGRSWSALDLVAGGLLPGGRDSAGGIVFADAGKVELAGDALHTENIALQNGVRLEHV